MSPNFEKVKKYYDLGLWKEWQVKNAVGKWITAQEAQQILGHKI